MKTFSKLLLYPYWLFHLLRIFFAISAIPPYQDILRTFRRPFSRKPRIIFDKDAARGSCLKEEKQGLALEPNTGQVRGGQGWATSAQGPSARMASVPRAKRVGEERAGLWGLQVLAAWAGGGPSAPHPPLGTCVRESPWVPLRPADGRRGGAAEGGGEGSRPFSLAIKGPGTPKLASASSDSAFAAFLPTSAPVPAKVPIDPLGLGYSGCSRRWRLQWLGPAAPRRRWLQPWRMCRN